MFPVTRFFVATVLFLSLTHAPDARATQTPRLAAFGLTCFGSPGAPTHTHATLTGKITLAKRIVRYVVSCADGPATAGYPTLYVEDGAVLQVDLTVTPTLTDGSTTLATNTCKVSSGNGYLTLRCIADEQRGGEVETLVSIAQ